jgi:dihydroorotate dehydrogenase
MKKRTDRLACKIKTQASHCRERQRVILQMFTGDSEETSASIFKTSLVPCNWGQQVSSKTSVPIHQTSQHNVLDYTKLNISSPKVDMRTNMNYYAESYQTISPTRSLTVLFSVSYYYYYYYYYYLTV